MYEQRITKVTVLHKDKPLFDRTATEIELQDEGCGEFIVVSQCIDERQELEFDLEEWVSVRDAIDEMAKRARAE